MRFFLLFLLMCCGVGAAKAQLVINELSNGNSGNKEWVELLVVGTPGCTAQCVDLRGWIIDDNNGTFNPASGQGVADGHMRFANVSTWACVPIGTLILIYNNNDRDTFIPADNLTGTNCTYVIPANSTLLEKNLTAPNASSIAFTGGTYSSGGDWNTTVLNNSNDSYQTRSPSNLAVPYSAVSYGGNNQNNIIYFAGPGAGNTYIMANTVDNNPLLQANWMVTAASIATPGYPNTAANAAWIHSMTNNCQPIVLPTVNAHNDTAICSGNTAKLYATPSITGGTFLWSNAATTDTILVTPAVTTTYTVEYTSVGGCKDTDTVVVNVNPSFIANVVTTNATCGLANGTAAASPTGAGYTYLWNSTPTQQTTATITALGAGTYTVTVTNASGCKSTASGVVTQSSATAVTIALTNPISCNGNLDGSLTATATGGVLPYTYTWSTTPIQQTTPTAIGLGAGSYTVTISDATGCLASATFNLTQPTALAATTAKVDVACFGGATGQASVRASGGTAPYTFVWSTLPPQTTDTIRNLTAGIYTVVTTDAHNCQFTTQVNINQPTVLAVTVNIVTPTTCGLANGSLGTTVTGGTTPYTYSWSTTPAQTAAAINNLAAGTYTVTVTDANGCIANNNNTLAPSTALVANVTTTPTNCNASTDGTATATVTSGTTPYTYSWSTTPAQTNNTATGLAGGTYTVTITDNAGCKDTLPAVVASPAPVTFNATTTDITCFGKGDGTIVLDNSALTYSFNGGTFTSQTTFLNMPAGIDTIIGKDGNGCADTLTNVTIAEPTKLEVTVTPDSALVTRGEQVTLDASTTGGTSPYVYDWQPATGLSCGDCSSQTITPTDSIIYSVIVRDTRGCVDTATTIINVRDAFLIAFPSGFSPNEDSKNDVFRAITNGPVDTYNLKVFNRWGQLIFETDNLKKGWDGTYKNEKQNIDTFVWLCEYKQIGATKTEKMKGSVTIVK